MMFFFLSAANEKSRKEAEKCERKFSFSRSKEETRFVIAFRINNAGDVFSEALKASSPMRATTNTF